MKLSAVLTVVCALFVGILLTAQGGRTASPVGTAATEIRGKYAGGPERVYEGGKWIEVTYGRPLKRGRELWGSGSFMGTRSRWCASVARRRQRDNAPQADLPLVIGARPSRQVCTPVHRHQARQLDVHCLELGGADDV